MTTEAIEATYREMPGTALALPQDAPKSFLDTLRPRDRIAMATEIADAIKDVIVQRGWLKRIGESDHVYVEGWQFVASLAGASCKVVSSEPLPDGKGWQAKAVVVRIDSGIEIGAGSGMCSRDERSWKSRDDYALRAMSETRAMSRALRGVFSFIVELAGYRATPAEEMPDHDTAPFRAAAPTAARRAQPVTVPRVPQDELLALAHAHGIDGLKALGAWCVEVGIAPDLLSRERKMLTNEETQAAKARLEIPPVKNAQNAATQPRGEAQALDDGSKVTPRTNGRLFALLDERLSTDKEARLIFAHEHGVEVDSFAKLTELQARTLIKQLEMIPPPEDPDDALLDYAEGKLF